MKQRLQYRAPREVIRRERERERPKEVTKTKLSGPARRNELREARVDLS